VYGETRRAWALVGLFSPNTPSLPASRAVPRASQSKLFIARHRGLTGIWNPSERRRQVDLCASQQIFSPIGRLRGGLTFQYSAEREGHSDPVTTGPQQQAARAFSGAQQPQLGPSREVSRFIEELRVWHYEFVLHWSGDSHASYRRPSSRCSRRGYRLVPAQAHSERSAQAGQPMRVMGQRGNVFRRNSFVPGKF
jgi:hypothetical protein